MAPMSFFRLIDANANRACEGLRVIEDVARFYLNDPALQTQLRNFRHQIRQSIPPEVLWKRETEGDVGRRSKGEAKLSLPQMVSANAKRVEEALRVLEDCLPRKASKFQAARFYIYKVEKQLLGRLRRPLIRGVYVITDNPNTALKALKDGASVIQFRDKLSSMQTKLRLAREFRKITCDHHVPLIINDHPDLALLVEADGVHLGQQDYPIALVRKLLPEWMCIGRSTHSLEQGLQAQKQGADYIGVGPVFPTPTKAGRPAVGLSYVRQAAKHVRIPWVAIGGIDKNNVGAVVASGAPCIAVIRAADQTRSLTTILKPD